MADYDPSDAILNGMSESEFFSLTKMLCTIGTGTNTKMMHKQKETGVFVFI